MKNNTGQVTLKDHIGIDELCLAVDRCRMQISRYKNDASLKADFKKYTKRTRRGKLIYNRDLVKVLNKHINQVFAV